MVLQELEGEEGGLLQGARVGAGGGTQEGGLTAMLRHGVVLFFGLKV